jgi:hypothetical protein
MTRNPSRFVTHWLAAVMLITLIAAKPESSTRPNAQQRKPGSTLWHPSARRLVVHEWGTFTAIAGRDGKPVEWRPLTGPSDLPSFVYDLGGAQDGKGLRHGDQCIKCTEALIRMETPVLYFYADREMTISVSVSFLNGTITEWYPQARSAIKGGLYGHVSWGRIRVLPGAVENLPVEPRPSHYYAARDTDAALISVCGNQEMQHEKFLFYRGLGDFDLPLTVKLEGDRLAINNTGRDAVANLIVFENRNGQIGYRLGELRNGELVIERPTLNQTQDGVEHQLVTLLTKKGLYEKEAQAMVATWRDSWFEDGLRVFYIVPRALTDKTLPLTIEPQPTELVRVLVGRTEVITPEIEQAIQKQLEPLNDASPDLHSITMQVIRTHGRFAEPILKEMLEKTDNERLRDYLKQIIHSSRAALE